MRRHRPSLPGLVLPALAAVLTGLAPGASDPHLSHGAPTLGQILTLTLDQAPPGVSVRLFQAAAAGDQATPYGLLELDRATLQVVGLGLTDSLGVWSVDLTQPSNPNLAESELHFQALVEDSGQPAGAVLSDAVHARLVGSRLYAGYRGLDTGGGQFASGGLQIVSAIHDTVVARVDYGATVPAGQSQGDGFPVFAQNLGRGAVMASPSKLLIFDPFFGTLLATRTFVEASRTLHLGPDGDTLLVLETGYRPPPQTAVGATLHVLELATGQTLTTLPLPSTAAGLWTLEESGTQACIAEFGSRGRTRLRRLDLLTMKTLDVLPVGAVESHAFNDLRAAAGQVFVATRSPDDAQGLQHSELTRVDLRGTSPRVQVQTSFRNLSVITPVPAANRLLFFDLDSFVPAGTLWMTRLDAPSPVVSTGLPWVYLHVDAAEAQDQGAWVVDASNNEPPSATDSGRLYHLDLPSLTWTQYPHAWAPFDTGPVALALVRDAFVDKIYLASREVPAPISIRPEIFVIDQASGTEGSLRIGFGPEMLLAAPVP